MISLVKIILSNDTRVKRIRAFFFFADSRRFNSK